MVGAYKPCAEFIKLARRLKLNAVFVNISFVGANALAKELGEDGKGVVVTQVVPFPGDMTEPRLSTLPFEDDHPHGRTRQGYEETLRWTDQPHARSSSSWHAGSSSTLCSSTSPLSAPMRSPKSSARTEKGWW